MNAIKMIGGLGVFVLGIIVSFSADAQPPPTAYKLVKIASIRCPVKQVRREVTTRLPAPWYNTPIIASLTRAMISRDKYLTCIYGKDPWEIGISRPFPERASVCKPERLGFNCFRRVRVHPAPRP